MGESGTQACQGVAPGTGDPGGAGGAGGRGSIHRQVHCGVCQRAGGREAGGGEEPEEQPLSRTLFGATTPEAATASAHAASSKAAKAAASDDSDGSDSDGARAREESARAHAQAVAAKAARKRDRALEKAQLSAPRSETAASKRARLTPPMLANAVMEVLETGGFDGKSTLGQMLDAVGDRLSVDVRSQKALVRELVRTEWQRRKLAFDTA